MESHKIPWFQTTNIHQPDATSIRTSIFAGQYLVALPRRHVLRARNDGACGAVSTASTLFGLGASSGWELLRLWSHWLDKSLAISGTDWLEVPTIYKAYVREYPHKIWPYMVQYLHFRILKFPLNKWGNRYIESMETYFSPIDHS